MKNEVDKVPNSGPSWPDPTGEEPDLMELLELSQFEDAFEATDGCWVEPDGVCEHGYPSWLLYWGLI